MSQGKVPDVVEPSIAMLACGGSATANSSQVHACPEGNAPGGPAKVARTDCPDAVPSAATDTELEHGTHTCAGTNDISARVRTHAWLTFLSSL